MAERALHIFSCFLYTTAIKCPTDFRKNADDLIQTFEYLTKDRLEVCAWFMSTFFLQSNVIQVSLGSPYLSGCELRGVFEKMVYIPIMICLNAMDEDNVNFNHNIDRIVDDVIAKMLQLCKTIPVDSTNSSYILKILIRISHNSINGARRLISQNALYSMISIFGFKDDSKFRMRVRDLDLVFELLNILLTSCTSMNKPKSDEHLVNPYSRKCSKPYYVPENCRAWFQNANNLLKFFTLLLDNRPEIEHLVQLCCYLCYGNIVTTTKLLGILNYRVSDIQQLRGTLDIVRELIKIDDFFKTERIKMALLGHEKGKVKGMLTECGYLSNLGHNNKVFQITIEFLSIWDDESTVREAIIDSSILIPALRSTRSCIEKSLESKNLRMILNMLRNTNEKLSTQLGSEKDQLNFIRMIISKIDEIMEMADKNKNDDNEKTENPPSYDSVISNDEPKNEESSSTMSCQRNPFLSPNDDES